MFKDLFTNFIRKATDWLFRVRSIERVLIFAPLSLLAAVYGGPRTDRNSVSYRIWRSSR